MPRYSVNATVSYLAWLSVDAANADAALEAAREASASDFEVETFGGQVEFNVSPVVEEESA